MKGNAQTQTKNNCFHLNASLESVLVYTSKARLFVHLIKSQALEDKARPQQSSQLSRDWRLYCNVTCHFWEIWSVIISLPCVPRHSQRYFTGVLSPRFGRKKWSCKGQIRFGPRNQDRLDSPSPHTFWSSPIASWRTPVLF